MDKNIDSKKKINLSEKLDFNEIDLTAPEMVVKEILSQLPEQTHEIVLGGIESYSGHIRSYKRTLTPIGEALWGGSKEQKVDIQDSLGAIGEERKKFECFLYTNIYPNYKYRLFFLNYDISIYPVSLTIEQSVARDLSRSAIDEDLFFCWNREELENLVYEILTCERTISVIQEIIRIAQVKKQETTNTGNQK